MNHYLKAQLFLIVVLLISIFGCNEKDLEIQELKSLNSFSMTLNDQLWQPSIIGSDSCMSLYNCSYSEIDYKDGSISSFYKIDAYKDSQLRSTFESDNIFQLQIKDVNTVGTYNISEPYGTFTSHARFIKNENGIQKIYDNSLTETSSIVTINSMLTPIDGLSGFNTGIEGSFSGILYNEIDPNDSIVIKNCQFTFKKINFYDFNQCAP